MRSVQVLGTAAILLAGLTSVLPTAADAQGRLSDAELESRATGLRNGIAELEDTRNKISQENQVLLQTGDGVVLIERDRVERLFNTLLFEGRMKLEDVAPAARHIGKMTRIYVTQIIDPDLQESRRDLAEIEAEIQRRRTVQPRNPGFVGHWPTPMDWRKVRGVVGGTFIVQCDSDQADGTRKPLDPQHGTFRLEFTGQGNLTGQIIDGAKSYPVNGTIDENGNAHGGGAGGFGSQYSWTASFARSGDVIVMTSHSLRLVPDAQGITCRPGYIRQE